jgi:phosphate transport system substrate-binding protein
MKQTAPYPWVQLFRPTTVACAGLLLLGLALSGCSNKNETPALAEGKVIIKGSNTIGEELAPRLIAEYKKEHAETAFELEFKATGYGLAALLAGQCDIAGASRTPIKEELELAQSRGIELNDHVIGAYSVAVIVHANNPVTNLTREQVRDIYTGAVQNWKEVGGPDAPILLYSRDPISGTYLGFRELAMENKPYGSGLKTATNYDGIVRAIARDPNGIGYCSIELQSTAGVRPVSIQGVAPSIASVKEGKYPYARVLRFYTQKGNERAAALDFIRFVGSARGQAIVEQTGTVPRP